MFLQGFNVSKNSWQSYARSDIIPNSALLSSFTGSHRMELGRNYGYTSNCKKFNIKYPQPMEFSMSLWLKLKKLQTLNYTNEIDSRRQKKRAKTFWKKKKER